MTPTTPAAKPLKHLTTRHMERAFGVTTMTLYLWRKGTATMSPLPVVARPDRRVAYSVPAVERWACRHGVRMVVPDLRALLAEDDLKPRKDGRRARTAVAERKPARKRQASAA